MKTVADMQSRDHDIFDEKLANSLSWKRCTFLKGSGICKCPHCNTQFNKTKLKQMIPVDAEVHIRNDATENVDFFIASLIAILIGGFIARSLGDIPFLWVILASLLFPFIKIAVSAISSAIFRGPRMHVYLYKCEWCKKITPVAYEQYGNKGPIKIFIGLNYHPSGAHSLKPDVSHGDVKESVEKGRVTYGSPNSRLGNH